MATSVEESVQTDGIVTTYFGKENAAYIDDLPGLTANNTMNNIHSGTAMMANAIHTANGGSSQGEHLDGWHCRDLPQRG